MFKSLVTLFVFVPLSVVTASLMIFIVLPVLCTAYAVNKLYYSLYHLAWPETEAERMEREKAEWRGRF